MSDEFEPYKPCPFCDCKEIYTITEYYYPVWRSYMQCSHCLTRGPVVTHTRYNEPDKRDKAADLWNTRQ